MRIRGIPFSGKGVKLMIRIRFTELKIDHISQSSGVFTGKNMPSGWQHRSKINEGFGHISGESNQTSHSVHVVNDRDFIDMISGKGHP